MWHINYDTDGAYMYQQKIVIAFYERSHWLTDLQAVNNKLLWHSYIYCRALDFELNYPQDTLKDRVIYFLGCRVYEVIIHYLLIAVINNYHTR